MQSILVTLKAGSAYLFKNLNYPQAAEKNEIQGEVIVEFMVKQMVNVRKYMPSADRKNYVHIQ